MLIRKITFLPQPFQVRQLPEDTIFHGFSFEKNKKTGRIELVGFLSTSEIIKDNLVEYAFTTARVGNTYPDYFKFLGSVNEDSEIYVFYTKEKEDVEKVKELINKPYSGFIDLSPRR